MKRFIILDLTNCQHGTAAGVASINSLHGGGILSLSGIARENLNQDHAAMYLANLVARNLGMIPTEKKLFHQKRAGGVFNVRVLGVRNTPTEQTFASANILLSACISDARNASHTPPENGFVCYASVGMTSLCGSLDIGGLG